VPNKAARYVLVIAEPEEWPKYRHRRGTYARGDRTVPGERAGAEGGAKYTDARVHVPRKVLTAPIIARARARARTGVISDILFRMGNRTDERELVEWELSSLSLRASL